MLKPMLARTGGEPFDSPAHIFEWKWNGVRILAHKEGRSVLLQGRSGADYTAQFPEVAAGIARIVADRAIIDGEVVCFAANGLPEFNRIQQRIGKREPAIIQAVARDYPATYMIFDVATVDRYDLTVSGARAPLMDRKKVLERLVGPDSAVKVSSYVDGRGIELHRRAVELNQEGIMAKTKSGLYYPGGRNQDWLKLKVPKYQDLMVCGWTKGAGARTGLLGAVILGRRDAQGLTYVGCAGSGFTDRGLEDMYTKLQALRTEENPFGHALHIPGFVSWVRPLMVARIKYFDVTEGGQLVWPIFQEVIDG